jgi:hypothetical protein
VLLDVDSIIEGTWGGTSHVPAEFVDYFLMREMRWSWQDLRDVPVYVKRYCYDFRQRELAAAKERQEAAERRIEARTRG